MKFLKYVFRVALVIFIYGILFYAFIILPAKAQIIDSSFYGWTIYEIQEEADFEYKKCYIVAHPNKADSDNISRDKPYIMITRYQKERIEEVSVYAGFDFKTASEIFLQIDNNIFKLKSKKDVAWAKTKYEDIRIIEAMLNSASIKVRSDSAVGNYAVDEYSLKGISKAYSRMRSICS